MKYIKKYLKAILLIIIVYFLYCIVKEQQKSEKLTKELLSCECYAHQDYLDSEIEFSFSTKINNKSPLNLKIKRHNEIILDTILNSTGKVLNNSKLKDFNILLSDTLFLKIENKEYVLYDFKNSLIYGRTMFSEIIIDCQGSGFIVFDVLNKKKAIYLKNDIIDK